MFTNLFYELKSAKLPVSLREYLTLLEAMNERVVQYDLNDFYYLSRSALVKDERNLDKFDQVFGKVFKGVEPTDPLTDTAEIPLDWLQKLNEKFLTDEEKVEEVRLKKLKLAAKDQMEEILRRSNE